MTAETLPEVHRPPADGAPGSPPAGAGSAGTDDARDEDSRNQALSDALSAVLRPLARLAVAQGLPYAAAVELLKRAYIDAARDAQPDPSALRRVSRIATATGITRREVKRLTENQRHASRWPRSLASQIFAHWSTSPDYRDRTGAPRVLPRLGPGVSFESLAQSVTRDVHPRSLLDELVRLGLARHDAELDTVSLQRELFVPRGNAARLLGFLGDNVGDHASAAVQNVVAGGRGHFEQAIFADELSAQSLKQVRAEIRAQWQALTEALVPTLERMIEDDRVLDRVRDQRLRIGLYTYNETIGEEAPGSGRDSAGQETK